MKTPAQLREAKGERVEQLDAISKAAQVEGRELTTEESQRAEDIIAEVENLDGQIARAEKIEATLKANAVAVDMSASSSDKREKAELSESFSLTEGIRALAQGRPLEGVLREMDQEARKEASESGISLRGEFNIPSFLSYGERTAYGVDGDHANAHLAGSDIIQKINAPVALSLQAKSVLQRAGATQLSGFSGDVQLPVMPGNGVTVSGGSGADNTETAAVTPGTDALTSTVLKPTRFAGAVDISKHLMYSMNGQLDDLFGRDLGNAIAARFDKHVLDKVVDKLETGGRIAVGTNDSGSNPGVAQATDFADVASLVGKYLAGNPDDVRRAFFLTPEMYSHLMAQTADAGGMIQAANFQEQLMGRPAYMTTQISNETILASAGFGEVDANDTVSVSPIILADASDIMVCTWAGLSVNVDVYTESLKGVVRVICDGYMDGNIRRAGSGAFLGGLTVNTAHTGV